MTKISMKDWGDLENYLSDTEAECKEARENMEEGQYKD